MTLYSLWRNFRSWGSELNAIEWLAYWRHLLLRRGESCPMTSLTKMTWSMSSTKNMPVDIFRVYPVKMLLESFIFVKWKVQCLLHRYWDINFEIQLSLFHTCLFPLIFNGLFHPAYCPGTSACCYGNLTIVTATKLSAGPYRKDWLKRPAGPNTSSAGTHPEASPLTNSRHGLPFSRIIDHHRIESEIGNSFCIL